MRAIKLISKETSFCLVTDFACSIVSGSDKQLPSLAVEEIIRVINHLNKKPPKDYDKIIIEKTINIDFLGHFYNGTLKDINFSGVRVKDFMELFVQCCFSYKCMADSVEGYMIEQTKTLINNLEKVAKTYGFCGANYGFMELSFNLINLELKDANAQIIYYLSLIYEVVSFAKNEYKRLLNNNQKVNNTFTFE